MRMQRLLLQTTARRAAIFKQHTFHSCCFQPTTTIHQMRNFSRIVSHQQQAEGDNEQQVQIETADEITALDVDAAFNVEETASALKEVDEFDDEKEGTTYLTERDIEFKSSFFLDAIEAQNQIDEEPVNFVPKNYERIKQYIDAQEAAEKKEDEDEDYRYEDPMKPRKTSPFGQWAREQIIHNQEELLNFFNFSEYAPVVTKDLIQQLQALPAPIANFALIDVRGRLAAQHYKIPGAINIPLKELTAAFELSAQDFANRYGSSKPDSVSNIVFLSEDMIETEFACVLVKTLVDGYNLVYNYRGGIQDWFGSGYKQLWRKSFVSDFNILLRYDQYGQIERSMIKRVKELTGESEEEATAA
jgi:rhodanese-related sulfurtransferase